MKNKKGFLFSIPLLITLGIILIALLVLGIIFGVKISEGLSAFWIFMTAWWWLIAVVVGGIIFRKQIIGIVNAILGRFGIKV